MVIKLTNMVKYMNQYTERMLFNPMDLTQPSQENVEYMIEAIKNKLKMASAAAMQASAFSVDKYEDIFDVYEVAMGSDRLSISQVEALVSELGRLRQK